MSNSLQDTELLSYNYIFSSRYINSELNSLSLITSRKLFSYIVLNMSSVLGAGIISMPYAISQCGIIFGTLFLILGMFMTYFACFCLIKVSEKLCKITYHSIGERLFSPLVGKISEILVVITTYSLFVYYISLLGNLPPRGDEILHIKGHIMNETHDWLMIFTLIILPIAYYRGIELLKYPSLLNVLGAILLTLIIIIECVLLRDDIGHRLASAISEVPFINISESTVLPFPLFILAFECQTTVLSIYSEIGYQYPEKSLFAIKLSLIVVFGMYFLVGIFGYLLFYFETHEFVLLDGDFREGRIGIYMVAYI